MKNPCYGCADRSAECHPQCERYKAFLADVAKARERRKAYEDSLYTEIDRQYRKQKCRRWEIPTMKRDKSGG